MNSLLHAINIGTLAGWLSVLAFGTAAVVIQHSKPTPPPTLAEVEIHILNDDFTLGDTVSAEPESGGEPPAESSLEMVEALPAPPELPEISESTPLPEVPDFPAAVPAKPTSTTAAASPRTTRPSSTGGPSSSSSTRTSGSGTPAGGSGTGSGSGMSDASRLAAGRMPAPSYPVAARRANQSGTVVVEFTVDSSGRVISAHAKSPSPWPLLNIEAVRTVRRWKFPPGGVMNLQRPIVFKLR